MSTPNQCEATYHSGIGTLLTAAYRHEFTMQEKGHKSVVKSVILSGGWLQPIQAGVHPGFMDLMRDRDSIYGVFSRNRVKNMGIKEVVSAPRSSSWSLLRVMFGQLAKPWSLTPSKRVVFYNEIKQKRNP